MIHAYQETYVNKAQSVLADLFDYAVNVCNISGEDFIKLFLASSISKRIENGEPNYLVGKSGIEIVMDIVEETMGKTIKIKPRERYSRTIEYWIGWTVSYYQWYTDRKFSEIFDAVSFSDLQNMYHTLHEADISKFVEIMDELIAKHCPDTNLKRIRTMYGCSQSILSKISGVNLRSIQMYEQRNKDINKASAETLYRLSRALGCSMEDLLEK